MKPKRILSFAGLTLTVFIGGILNKGRLMTEYLMDVKGVSYDDILDESITEASVYSELLNWYEEQK